MSEKELNEKYIRDNIKGICQDCMYLDKIVPIINNMLSEEYKNGLHQGWFDREMDMLNITGELNFLRERENKLQIIEQMFANEPVDLTQLAKLVKGGE